MFTKAEVLENTMSDLEKHHIGFGQEKRRNPLIRIVISGLRMLPKFWFYVENGRVMLSLSVHIEARHDLFAGAFAIIRFAENIFDLFCRKIPKIFKL